MINMEDSLEDMPKLEYATPCMSIVCEKYVDIWKVFPVIKDVHLDESTVCCA